MTDKEEIIRALKLWFLPGDVFEIRILKAVAPGYLKPHTESGYFDYGNIPTAADAIGKLRAYAGAYVTINPVSPELLARACNRFCPAESESTTADSDIVKRRWLLIDCDAVRKAKISSTDAEHEAALAKAREIRDGLTSLGWPMPVMLDSGNGAQMTYRIDLPADDGGVVQQAVTEIAKASSDAVKVDLTVYNPARIWRIPGTMNCKGDSIPARPHRMAKILEVPESVEIVPTELLQRIAGESSKTPPAHIESVVTSYQESPGFDIDEWIAKYAPDAGQPQSYKGGRKWIFNICPFNPEHDNKSATLTETPDGAIGFRCLHDHCLGNDWRKFRVMREPGCYDHRQEDENLPPVNITGIMNQQGKSVAVPVKKDDAENFSDPGRMKERLLHVPGFIDELTDFSMGCAPKPNRVLSFCGALAFLSYLAGRNVTDERNNRPNIYLIALANSGVGKEQPRRINMTVAAATDPKLCDGLADSFASGEGLEDALFMNPTMLFQVDEMDTLLNSMKTKDSRAEGLIEKMLRIFTASAAAYKLRSRAIPRGDLARMKESQRNGTPGRSAEVIHNPYLVIFGTAIPQLFYQALDHRLLTNGLTARCLIIEAGERGRKNKACIIKVPESLIRAVKVILSYGDAGNLTDVNPPPMTIPVSSDADAMLDELDERYDTIYRKYSKMNALIPMAFWARAFEKVCKLSQLYAISANMTKPIIDKDAVRWASQFVEYLTEQTLFLTHSYSYENPFDEKCQKALRYIREAGGSYRHGALLKRMHDSADVFKKVIETLRENESISIEVDSKATTKNAILYRLR